LGVTGVHAVGAHCSGGRRGSAGRLPVTTHQAGAVAAHKGVLVVVERLKHHDAVLGLVESVGGGRQQHHQRQQHQAPPQHYRLGCALMGPPGMLHLSLRSRSRPKELDTLCFPTTERSLLFSELHSREQREGSNLVSTICTRVPSFRTLYLCNGRSTLQDVNGTNDCWCIGSDTSPLSPA
jgi:hypothetical protein